MEVPPPSPLARQVLDAGGRIIGDAPCVGCGYNLRTLSADGVCPECALPVAQSLRGHFLRFGPPTWVRGLARGMLFLLAAVGGTLLLGPLLSLVLSVPLILSTARNLGPPSTFQIQIMAVGQFLFNAICTGVAIAGLILLTRRDPRVGDQPEGLTARRVLRFSCVLLPLPITVNLVAALCMPPLPALGPGAPPPTPAALLGSGLSAFITLGLVSGVVAMIVYAVTPLALMRHLAHLLARIPRPGLVRFARIELWGLLVSVAVLTVGYVLIAAAILPVLGTLTAAAAGAPPASAPAPATAPAGPDSSLAPGSATPATQPSTLPTSVPFPRPRPGFLAGFFFAAGGAALGGCGSFAFGIAGVVLLVLASVALFQAAREAEQNADSAGGP